MSEEDKKLQKHLVEEMMKVSKTNPDVMYYMESLMEYCLKIEKENNKQKEVLNKIKEDIEFCINNLKNEYACTDKRTNRELHTTVKILEEALEEIE